MIIQNTKADFEHNGIKYPATVTVRMEYDNDSPEGSFDYGDEEANAKELARFKSGELESFCLIVEVSAFGVTASDVLGGVWVDHTQKKNAETQLIEAAEYHDMTANALNDLVINIVSQANELKRFAEGV